MKGGGDDQKCRGRDKGRPREEEDQGEKKIQERRGKKQRQKIEKKK